MKAQYVGVLVYIGEHGEYSIPPDVEAEALRLNAGKPISDRRTRGSRKLAQWGKNEDAKRHTISSIRKHFPETVTKGKS